MQLAPFLLTRETVVNDQVPLLASRHNWKEHVVLSRSKLNIGSNLERAVSLAEDEGLSVIRNVVRRVHVGGGFGAPGHRRGRGQHGRRTGKSATCILGCECWMCLLFLVFRMGG